MRLPANPRRRWLLVLPALAGVPLFFTSLARSLEPSPPATITLRPTRFVREVEAHGVLKPVRVTPIVVPQAARRAQRIAALVRDGARVEAGELVVSFDPYDSRREEADGLDDVQAARARLTRGEATARRDRRSIEIDIDLAAEELKRAESAQLGDEQLYSRHEIISSRLSRELAQSRLEVSGRRLSASGQLASTERALGEIDAGKARLRIELARKGLAALRVLAPHEGIFVLDRSWRGETAQVGDTLWPGQRIGELPDLSRLEARVQVLEADGAGLRPGLGSELAIEGRPGETYAATVSRVDPLAKASGWPSPVKYFEIALELGQTNTSLMRPGQRVRALVRLETADDVLVVPRAAVFEVEGKRFVYRRRARAFVPVEIRIARQSAAAVVLASGLAAGDVVALRDPRAERRSPASSARPAGANR